MPHDGSTSEPRDRLALLGEIAAELAHELGNVLQVAAGSAYVARTHAERGDCAAGLPHADKALRSVRQAQQLVEDVMALARGGALSAEPVPVEELVASAREDLPTAGAQWKDVIEPPGLVVRAHAGLFARMLHALYDNAIRASAPRPPTVTTRANVTDGVLWLEVSDDGPGVPGEITNRVFEPLVSGGRGGSGLGLALARRVVEAHGGQMSLVRAEGGAIFRVEMPADSEHHWRTLSPAGFG